MGLGIKGFLSITWYEYTVILGAHHKREAKAWEHTRFIAYWTYWANTDVDREIITDFLPLITDPPPEPPEILTEEDTIKIIAEAQMRAGLFKIKRDGGS